MDFVLVGGAKPHELGLKGPHCFLPARSVISRLELQELRSGNESKTYQTTMKEDRNSVIYNMNDSLEVLNSSNALRLSIAVS